MKLSIRGKLFIGICTPIAIIYILVLAVEYRLRKVEATSSMETYLRGMTESEASEIDIKLSSMAQTCNTAVEILKHYRPAKPEDTIDFLQKCIISNKDIYGMIIAYEPGAAFKDKKFFSPYFYRPKNSGGAQVR